MHSIRRFLSISILTVMTVFYAITAYWNYNETLHDIHELFDEQLINSNILLQHSNPEKIEELVTQARGKHSIHRAYQVWNTTGELLTRSADTSSLPLSNHQPGLKAYQMGEHTWHTYTVVDANDQRIFITAQRGDMRDALAHELAIRHIIPFLITFPMIWIALWLLISHGFTPLHLVTRQLNDRQFDNLSPIQAKSMPSEIAPTVDAMNALFNRLNSAYEREQRFTADAAHELRTPLAAIRTMAQLALGYKDIKSVHECLQDVLLGVDRCTHVVKQLAVLNSLRPEEIMNELERVNLNQVIHQITRELQIMADNKQIDIDFSLPAPCFIEANLASIQILLRNLIDNALRYSPELSKITLSTQKTEDGAILRVEDQGPGIPQELHQRVFERFYRELGTGETGTGLGLSIVSTICQLHRAQVALAQGENGQGLVVTIKFPTRL